MKICDICDGSGGWHRERCPRLKPSLPADDQVVMGQHALAREIISGVQLEEHQVGYLMRVLRAFQRNNA